MSQFKHVCARQDKSDRNIRLWASTTRFLSLSLFNVYLTSKIIKHFFLVKCLPAYVRLTEPRDKTPGGVSGSKQVTVITMLLLPWLHCGVVCMAAQRAPLARIQYVPYILLFATRELSAVTASKCISYLKTTVTEHIKADEVVSVTLEGDCTAHTSAYTGESGLCVCTSFC